MYSNEPIILKRDCEAAVIPVGTRVTLEAGEPAYVTQTLGGSYTVVVNGNMFRIDGKDADALGFEPAPRAPSPPTSASGSAQGRARPREEVEKHVWDQLRTCYDPEIPVNIVDLGLIYDCTVEPLPGASTYRVQIKMTLTAPGCGMGEFLQQDAQAKLMSIEDVDEVEVELVWEPQWTQAMMSEAAQLQLGML